MTGNNLRGVARISIRAISPSLWERIRSLRRSILNRRSRDAVFGEIYRRNIWGSSESVSGPGSTLDSTANIRAALPDLLQRHNIRSILDLPCGDAGWIARCLPEDVSYIGADIVPDLIAKNACEMSALGRFMMCDLASDPLPDADLLLVRDCFIHLPNATVRQCLANIRASNIQWLLTTTNLALDTNEDIDLGGYRPIRLECPPFDLPEPIELIREYDDATTGYGKALGLWRVADLPD